MTHPREISYDLAMPICIYPGEVDLEGVTAWFSIDSDDPDCITATLICLPFGETILPRALIQDAIGIKALAKIESNAADHFFETYDPTYDGDHAYDVWANENRA